MVAIKIGITGNFYRISNNLYWQTRSNCKNRLHQNYEIHLIAHMVRDE